MKNNRLKDMALIALFPALMGATSTVSIPFGGYAPITLQTLFVFMSGLILGPKKAFLSISIYLLMGSMGLPMFSGGSGGMGVLLGATAGFLFMFPIAAFFTGIHKNIKFINKQIWLLVPFMLVVNVLIYMSGAAYLSYYLKVSYFPLLLSFWSYIPGDIIKIIAASYVYKRIRNHITYE